MNAAIISVGSNEDPEHNVGRARELVAERYELVRSSEFVRTEPVARPDQPDYLNGAFLVHTEQNRRGLRAGLKRIEREMGRVRTSDPHAPRPIDLDIVVWNGEVVDEDYHTREFVRLACLEVMPELEEA